MKPRTLILIGGMAAVVGIGAGVAMAERGPGGGGEREWRGERGHHGAHHGGRHGGMRWGRGEVTKEDFLERARGRFGRLDANSDGKIDRAELEQRMADRMGRRMARRADRGMDRMFKRLDADNDQKITRDEFKARIAERFKRGDIDGDGAITDADLPPMMRGANALSGDSDVGRGRHGGRGHRMSRMIERLRAANTDNDGKVTLAEVEAAADAQFARFDRNGDGSLDQADRDQLNKETVDYRVARFLSRFDAAQAGEVTREAYLAKAEQRFAQMDTDGDGKLERGRGKGGRGGHGGWRRHHGEGRGASDMMERGPGAGDEGPSNDDRSEPPRQ